MKETEEKLVAIICDYVDIQPEEVDTNMSLKFDIGLDSFGMVSLICTIENEFDISIPDNKLMDFETLNDMTTFIYQEKYVLA